MSPYIVTASRPRPKHLIPETILMAFDVTYQRAFVTLEERICFNSREWERAGYDQPDGNLQFYHHVLILSKRPPRERWMPNGEVADVLWLHDGSISNGHYLDMMGEPGKPTRFDRERFPAAPERWADRLIYENNATIELSNGTVIEVAQRKRSELYRELPAIVQARFGSWTTDEQVCSAWNANYARVAGHGR